MSFTFSAIEMMQDLQALADGGSKFLAPQMATRIERLSSDLKFAVSKAKGESDKEFKWKTAAGAPVVLKKSKNWKGVKDEADELQAEVTVDYKCIWDETTSRVRVKEGVTCVLIRDSERSVKSFHFDACDGGWDNSAAHPPFHMQIHGHVNDIPRLPSIVVHPVDVLNFTFLELHQSHWRTYVESNDAKQKLRHLPSRQKARLIKIVDDWSKTLKGGPNALVRLQQRMPASLDL